MSPSGREHLRRLLAERLDEKAAATLMESLPPMDRQDLARNEDVLALRRDVDGLRNGVDTLGVEVKHEIGMLRHELTASFRGELVAAVGQQSRHMIVGMVSSVVAMGGFAIALQQLG